MSSAVRTYDREFDRGDSRSTSKNFFGCPKNFLDVQKHFGRPKTFLAVQEIFWTSKNFFGRPKHFLDIQKLFWTSKTFFGRPKLFWTSKTKIFGRPKKNFWTSKNFLDVQKIFFSIAVLGGALPPQQKTGGLVGSAPRPKLKTYENLKSTTRLLD